MKGFINLKNVFENELAHEDTSARFNQKYTLDWLYKHSEMKKETCPVKVVLLKKEYFLCTTYPESLVTTHHNENPETLENFLEYYLKLHTPLFNDSHSANTQKAELASRRNTEHVPQVHVVEFTSSLQEIEKEKPLY